MCKGTGYSLWIQPEGDTEAHLSRLISKLAADHGGPVFLPHMTLLGGITGKEEQIADKTGALAETLKPFNVAISGMSEQEEYFKCLFLVINETREVANFMRCARRCYGLEEIISFMPHLSILYGHYDQGVKDRAMETVDEVCFDGFTASRMALWRTTGPVEEWRQIAEYRLAGS